MWCVREKEKKDIRMGEMEIRKGWAHEEERKGRKVIKKKISPFSTEGQKVTHFNSVSEESGKVRK